jgi:integrase
VRPDRHTIAGKRDYALLRVLGDCGLRSAELRGLRARDLRRPRANARHHRLYVRGKGGREREVPVPEAQPVRGGGSPGAASPSTRRQYVAMFPGLWRPAGLRARPACRLAARSPKVIPLAQNLTVTQEVASI